MEPACSSDVLHLTPSPDMQCSLVTDLFVSVSSTRLGRDLVLMARAASLFRLH